MKHLVCAQCFAKTLQLLCKSSFVAACVLPLVLMPSQLTFVSIRNCNCMHEDLARSSGTSGNTAEYKVTCTRMSASSSSSMLAKSNTFDASVCKQLMSASVLGASADWSVGILLPMTALSSHSRRELQAQ